MAIHFEKNRVENASIDLAASRMRSGRSTNELIPLNDSIFHPSVYNPGSQTFEFGCVLKTRACLALDWFWSQQRCQRLLRRMFEVET